MNRRSLSAFILILLIAFTFRLWQLGTQSLWHDEGWSVFSAYNPFAPMGVRGSDLNAPWAYYASLGVWLRLAGDAVWTMRYWSVLLGVITVAVAIRVARDMFGDRAAVLTGLLVAINPILWLFSQEIRAYVVMPLAALLLLGLSERWLRRGSWQSLAMIAVVEYFALYSQNLSVPLVAWLNVTVGLILLWRRAWRRMAVWLAVQIVLLILYLPWLLTQRPTGTVLNTPPVINVELLWSIWQSMFTGIKAMINADGVLMGLIAVMGVLGAISIVRVVIRGRDLKVLLLVSQVVLVPIFELGIIWAAHIDFHPRYFIVSVPTTLMLIAWGVTLSPESATQRTRTSQALAWLASAGVGVVAILIMGRMVTLMYSSPTYQHDDFRSIAAHYAALSENDAIVIPYGWEPSLDYYREKMGFKARVIEVPLHTSADEVIERLTQELEGIERVEVLTWFQLPADVRGAFPCILNSIATQTENSLTTSGLRTDQYVDVRAPQITAVEAREIRFGEAQLNASETAFYWGNAGLCALSQWQMNAPTSQQWRLVVRLYNDLGWLIGQSDHLLLNDQQLPTSYWKPNVISTQFSYIPLPAGVPNEAYTATISVYDEAHPQGLESEQVLGREVAISTDAIRKQTVLESVGEIGEQDMMVREGVYLHRKELPERLTQGQRVQVSIEWWRTQTTQASGELALIGADWVARPSKGDCTAALNSNETGKMLNWCEIAVPPTANGSAELAVMDGDEKMVLATYTLDEIARIFSAPAFLFATQPETPAEFPQVGSLIGASIGDEIGAGTPPEVTLMWKATGTAEIGYKVFVHLIDADEQVIAQSDAEPVSGERPTYGWVAGEYILDKHVLMYNQPSFTGEVRLAVGLYDPSTGQRVKLADGSDRIVLPLMITIK
jgi:hypothetical protein